jgi:hypothetical protein
MKTENKNARFFVGLKKESYELCFGKIGKKLEEMSEVVVSVSLLSSRRCRGGL